MTFYFCLLYITLQDRQIDQIIDVPLEGLPQKSLGRAFSDILLHKAASLGSPQRDCVHCSSISQPNETNGGRSSEDALRASYSSTINTTSSVESSIGDTLLSSIFVWGEGFDDGESFPEKDAFMPKLLESASALDAENIACGSTHAMLVTRQGQIFSWGDGSGGKLGHGLDADIFRPKLIDSLGGLNIVSVGCGEYHTCAVTQTGDLYTWGDGIHNVGLLGHGTEFSYWTPRKVRGEMEGIHVISVSCGPWHSATITSQGQLFTFGEGTFGALGHGDRCSTNFPREVEAFKGQYVLKVSCGFWHTAAVVEFPSESPSCGNSTRGKLFTWGNGDEGQLGHGDELSRLTPYCVSTLNDTSFSQVACGHSITVALTVCGKVYTLGVTDRGELKRPGDSHVLPTRVESKLKDRVIKEIACGSHHIAVVTSTSEIFTWGKGRNGQLGHGDNADRYFPTPVKALEGKHVKRVTCGNNYTVAICLQQWVRSSDYSVCSGCHNPFNFMRKRHNCYNCGLLFCNDCTSKRSLHASLAPNLNRLYRVCDDCYSKLNKGLNSRVNSLPPRSRSRSSSISLPGNTKEKKKDSFKAPQGSVLSKLSSFDSLRRSKKEPAKKNEKVDTSSNHNSPIHGGTTGYDGSPASSPSISIVDGCDRINALLPCSISSPASTKSTNSLLLHSSFHYHPFQEEVGGDLKHINDDLAEEISFLREQVNYTHVKGGIYFY